MTRLQANLLLLLSALIWGTTFIVQQTVLTHMPPIAFTAARFLLGAAVVAPLAWFELRRLRAEGHAPSKHSLAAMVATGGALFAGAVLQQLGIGLTTVTNASFLTALYVPLVPLLAVVATRTAPSPIVWPAAAACLVGTWLMGGAHSLSLSAGDLYVIVGALFWAVHILMVGYSGSRAPLVLAVVQFTVCGLLGAATSAVTEDFSLGQLAPAWFEVIYAGLLSCGVAFTVQVFAQRFAAAADAAIIFSLEAVFATIAGVLLLAERPNALVLTGCAIITIAAIAVQLVPSRHEPTEEAS